MKNGLLNRLSLYFLMATMLVLASCNDDDNEESATPIGRSKPTASYSATLAQDWMREGYNTVKREGWLALDASRTYAYTAIAMYESMVHGIPDGKSLEGQLKGLTNLPKPDPNKEYDWALVMCHVAPKVMIGTFPSSLSQDSKTRMGTIESQQEEAIVRQNSIGAEVRSNSLEFGDQLAKAIVDWSTTDNRRGLELIPYTPPSRVNNGQYWSGDYGYNVVNPPMMPFWWTQRTFVLGTHTLCEPEAPFAYSTDPSSDFYKEVKEVYDASLDPAKVAIGNYWANNPKVSGSPAGSWLNISTQLVDQLKVDLPNSLRMYVLLTISTRDGFLASWYLKYKYYLERPVTYIREVISNDIPAAKTWTSPVPTPPYPDYTSGTSVNGGSSSTMLTKLFGENVKFSDSQHADKGMGVRQFNSFREAGIEAFHSRIFGGVHMRRACAKGFEQGSCVANYVYDNIDFTK